MFRRFRLPVIPVQPEPAVPIEEPEIDKVSVRQSPTEYPVYVLPYYTRLYMQRRYTPTAGTVTITMPPMAGYRLMIPKMWFTEYFTDTRIGGIAHVQINTSNIHSDRIHDLYFYFPTAGAVGTVHAEQFDFNPPLEADEDTSDTTVTVPATSDVRWSFGVTYFYRENP